MTLRVLVTGGAGFIGSHVVDALLDGGADVRVIDSLDPSAHGPGGGSALDLDPRAELLVGDLADPHWAAAAVAGVDAVCHQAAKVGLGVDFGDVTGYVRGNDTGTAVLLDALWRNGFRGRLVLASSMVVYGEGLARCPVHGLVAPAARSADDLGSGRFEPRCSRAGCGAEVRWVPVDESAPADPRNVYAATKLHQEHLCDLWGRAAGGTVVALRYHNVYGPRMPRDTPYAGVASIFRSALAAGRPALVFEDGGQSRDFVHVRDVARANVLALTADVGPGAYNVASGRPRTVLDMAEALTDAFGPGAPRPEVRGGWRPGDVRHIVASPRKAAEELGFEAAIGFEEGMAEFARAPQRGRRHPVTLVAGSDGQAFWRSFTGYQRRSNARTGWRSRPVSVFLASGAVGVMLSAHIARGGPLLTVRWRFLAELAVWAIAWGVGVGAALLLPRRTGTWLILAVAVALRGAALAGPPTTTDDFHRYSWDGRVQAAGVNPYEYTPGSPELAGLREPWLWPAERPCPLAYRPDDCTRINRSSVPTIYPPLAEAWFGGIYRLTGIGARWKPWQVAGLLTDVAVVALLAVALRRRGRDPRWCALYALCPAPVLEIVNNGHVDGLAVLLAVAALAVAAPPGSARREVAAGALVGAAALVKLFPLLLIVALVAASADRRRRALARVGGAAALVVGAGYLPHLLEVGTKVVGFLPGYVREEGYDGAGRYLVAGALGLPGEVAGLLSALAVVGAAGWVWTRRPAAPVGAAVLLGTLLLAASPVQPWYAVTLLAFAALAVEPKWSAIVAAGYPYFFAVILLHPNRTGIGQLAYGLAAAAVAAPFLLRGSPAAARSMEACPPNGC